MTDTPLTMQQLFTLNWRRFRHHPELRAVVEEGDVTHMAGDCRHRLDDPTDPHGWRGCAIGNWFPDDVYDPKMENHRINALLNPELSTYSPALAALFAECHVEFLLQCQGAHDYYVEDFEVRMRQIAEQFHLTIPPDEEVATASS